MDPFHTLTFETFPSLIMDPFHTLNFDFAGITEPFFNKGSISTIGLDVGKLDWDACFYGFRFGRKWLCHQDYPSLIQLNHGGASLQVFEPDFESKVSICLDINDESSEKSTSLFDKLFPKVTPTPEIEQSAEEKAQDTVSTICCLSLAVTTFMLTPGNFLERFASTTVSCLSYYYCPHILQAIVANGITMCIFSNTFSSLRYVGAGIQYVIYAFGRFMLVGVERSAAFLVFHLQRLQNISQKYKQQPFPYHNMHRV